MPFVTVGRENSADNTAQQMSPHATLACVDTWLTDFRGDLPKFDVPTLVIHGEKDRILVNPALLSFLAK
jgi:non-heme chloroperoxidase